MKKSRAGILFAVFFIFISISRISYGEVVDKIVAIVNNEIITQREVDRLLASLYAQYRTMYYGDTLIKKLEEARERVLRDLIEDRLILSEAKKLGITASEKEVDAKMGEIKKQFASDEEFERALSQQNMTLKELRTRYHEKIMVRRLVDQKVGSRVNVSPAEVVTYYDLHPDMFVQPEEIKIRNILIKPKKDLQSEKKARELAEEIIRRLREGGDFALLAKTYSEGPGASEGGAMGFVRRGDLMPEIETVVFRLKEGEVSGIVQTNLGYHIFKVDEKKAAKKRDFSEVRQDVEEAIYREKVQNKLKGWIDNLRKNAYIEFR